VEQVNYRRIGEGGRQYQVCAPHARGLGRNVERRRGVSGLERPDRLRFLKYPDGDLSSFRGRHFSTTGSYSEVEGAVGMQNTFAYILRQIRPTRVFIPTSTDLHPDHRTAHEELMISLFHAQGNIWPELGQPIAEVPKVYEFAVYCDFPEPPQIRIETPPAMLEVKLAGIRAYASQEQGANRRDRGHSAGRRADRIPPRTDVQPLPPATVSSAFHADRLMRYASRATPAAPM